MGPLKLVRRPVGHGNYVLSWQPVAEPWEFTDADVAREAAVLERLAVETARTDPWTAATNLFGGNPMNDTTTMPEPPLSVLPSCDLSEVLDRIVPDRPAVPLAEAPLTFNSSI